MTPLDPMSSSAGSGPDQIEGTLALRVRDDVATAELDGDILVYDARTEMLHVLNRTAAVLWTCLDGEATIDQLASDLAAVYHADLGTVRRDVGDAARHLFELGLLDGGRALPRVTAQPTRHRPAAAHPEVTP